ncbi:MAG: UDP-2,4-diacetamido-2,4,6-trideoxy-beta-L-altropyranose hydrolase [Nitrospirae bacterium]|nr:UDP-2,4-diacetamido-2,4,6-trideoxy-beta-L-altropyranose hydrolase [Nitrospirota bacterium]
MKVAIRVDSSFKMGSGHLMRCLTLAEGLHERGFDISFLCRELPGNMIEHVEIKGYTVHRLPYIEGKRKAVSIKVAHSDWLGVDWRTDAAETKSVIEKDGCTDWLIVDHYALDRHWEEQMRQFVKNIMVIDDLADRPHDCDILLDQNMYEGINNRYNGLVPASCKKLLGPTHALLRKEFIEARKNLRERDGQVRNILIFFGGVDPSNETLKALDAIQLLSRPEITVDVVVGTANPHKDKIKDVCSSMPNVYYHCQVDCMARLMVNADLAIGGGGTTTWERCLLALPTIILVIAENQMETTTTVAKAGAVINLGWSRLVSTEKIAAAIRKTIANKHLMKEISNKSISLMIAQNNSVLFDDLIK